MSCNGCRVLRKGCSETCILRPCIQWIDTPEAQGHATVFVAKFFGRAGLMSFISNVPDNQRPALFQSLLYEACGRTVNPVSGAVGLLWTGNWHVNQAAVETILRGGSLKPIPEFLIGAPPSPTSLSYDVSEVACPIKPVSHNMLQDLNTPRFTNTKRVKDDNNMFDMSSKRCRLEQQQQQQKVHNFDLSLTPPSFFRETAKQRPGTPSFNSEESATTTTTTTTVCFDSVRNSVVSRRETKLLDLFV